MFRGVCCGTWFEKNESRSVTMESAGLLRRGGQAPGRSEFLS
jgi:hypothetical protein